MFFRRSISIRCQGYIGDFVLGSHATDMVVLCFRKLMCCEPSIPSEDPYEEAARQLLEQAPRSSEYVPDPIELKDHVPVYIPEPEHLEDLVPAEDKAPTPLLPPFFLSPRIRPPHTRAAMRQMRAAAPSTYHSLLPSGTHHCYLYLYLHHLLAAELIFPRLIHRLGRGYYLLLLDLVVRLGIVLLLLRDSQDPLWPIESIIVDVRNRESLEFYSRHHDAQKDRAAMRVEIEVLRRERLAYEQESIQTRRTWLGLKLTTGH
ncbi:hypothetical protein Tco_0086390 [Tanacetum coccineum]